MGHYTLTTKVGNKMYCLPNLLLVLLIGPLNLPFRSGAVEADIDGLESGENETGDIQAPETHIAAENKHFLNALQKQFNKIGYSVSEIPEPIGSGMPSDTDLSPQISAIIDDLERNKHNRTSSVHPVPLNHHNNNKGEKSKLDKIFDTIQQVVHDSETHDADHHHHEHVPQDETTETQIAIIPPTQHSHTNHRPVPEDEVTNEAQITIIPHSNQEHRDIMATDSSQITTTAEEVNSGENEKDAPSFDSAHHSKNGSKSLEQALETLARVKHLLVSRPGNKSISESEVSHIVEDIDEVMDTLQNLPQVEGGAGQPSHLTAKDQADLEAREEMIVSQMRVNDVSNAEEARREVGRHLGKISLEAKQLMHPEPPEAEEAKDTDEGDDNDDTIQIEMVDLSHILEQAEDPNGHKRRMKEAYDLIQNLKVSENTTTNGNDDNVRNLVKTIREIDRHHREAPMSVGNSNAQANVIQGGNSVEEKAAEVVGTEKPKLSIASTPKSESSANKEVKMIEEEPLPDINVTPEVNFNGGIPEGMDDLKKEYPQGKWPDSDVWPNGVPNELSFQLQDVIESNPKLAEEIRKSASPGQWVPPELPHINVVHHDDVNPYNADYAPVISLNGYEYAIPQDWHQNDNTLDWNGAGYPEKMPERKARTLDDYEDKDVLDPQRLEDIIRAEKFQPPNTNHRVREHDARI